MKRNPSQRKKVFAIASKGGHWVQLMRLAPALEERYDVIYASTKSAYADAVKGHQFIALKDFTRRNPHLIVPVLSAVMGIIRRERPDVVLTTGAAPGLTAIIAARLLGVKTIWIDSMANVEHMSLSGRLAKGLASKVFVQWEHLANGKLTYAGNILG